MVGFYIYFFVFRFCFEHFNIFPAYKFLSFPSSDACIVTFTYIFKYESVRVLYLNLRVLHALFCLLQEVRFLCHDAIDSISEAYHIEALDVHCNFMHQQLLDFTLFLPLVPCHDGSNVLHEEC